MRDKLDVLLVVKSVNLRGKSQVSNLRNNDEVQCRFVSHPEKFCSFSVIKKKRFVISGEPSVPERHLGKNTARDILFFFVNRSSGNSSKLARNREYVRCPSTRTRRMRKSPARVF